MERTIVHCDLDAFFVSVERLLNSELVGKPVLIGGNSDRGVVASCSYEARKYGVHSAMPMRLARQLCPEAILVRGDHDLYSKYSNIVTEIIEEQIPVVEKASIDEHYLDMTGMDKFFGTWKLTQELRQRIIKETGLPISFGLSVNKTVSKIATGEAKPCGERKVEGGTEKPFLAPLSIRKIPGIGEKTYPLLRNMGISHIYTLQQMNVFTMRQVLGENGVSIWNKANGIDKSEVVPFHQQKSMSKEHTFEKDTIDMDLLRRIMLSMVDELAFDLRKEGKLTACVTVKIRYSNFDTHTMQAKLSFTASER
ncbi:MAG TPA: DNA polymerase IV, partial [Aequorivita sp.]|nr:DNA polymerase IV [Aequorivita sp.]